MKLTRNTDFLIFDFDGTLANTESIILATMFATIGELQLPLKTAAECKATIGLRLEDVPAALWPDHRGHGELFATTYRRIFDTLKTDYPVRPYPGVISTLRQLHSAGYGMAVASSRNEESLEEYLTEFGVRELFNDVVGGNRVARGKPAPDPVLRICRTTGRRPDECLVVGDAVVDIMMGRAAGCPTCAVTYGNQSRAELLTANPTYIIDKFTDLTDTNA